MPQYFYDLVETIKGDFVVQFSEKGIFELFFPETLTEIPYPRQDLPYPGFKADLNRYLKGVKVDWSPYPLDSSKYPLFTGRLLEAMAKIPYGAVVTYREMAEQAGSPRAFRAAGGACGANRHPIIVP